VLSENDTAVGVYNRSLGNFEHIRRMIFQ
jgi:hypothetical protein